MVAQMPQAQIENPSSIPSVGWNRLPVVAQAMISSTHPPNANNCRQAVTNLPT